MIAGAAPGRYLLPTNPAFHSIAALGLLLKVSKSWCVVMVTSWVISEEELDGFGGKGPENRSFMPQLVVKASHIR